MHIGLAGSSALVPQAEIVGSLDELIYAVTSTALTNGQMTIDDVEGVCMASSDLNDGRAISTMTLTGSTGSFHKTEMRVCNDGLAALLLAAAEVASGAADGLIVCAWTKFSDVPDPEAITPLSLEPAFNRPLHYHPGAVLKLRESFETRSITVTDDIPITPHDVAVAHVIVREGHPKAGNIAFTGFGSAMGPYLRPGEPVLKPIVTAATFALKMGGRTAADLVKVYVAGMHRVVDAKIAEALGVLESTIVRQRPRWADLGYAAGLNSLSNALQDGVTGPTLIVSAGGLGLENANAVLMETK